MGSKDTATPPDMNIVSSSAVEQRASVLLNQGGLQGVLRILLAVERALSLGAEIRSPALVVVDTREHGHIVKWRNGDNDEYLRDAPPTSHPRGGGCDP